jgi:hypothetical protein
MCPHDSREGQHLNRARRNDCNSCAHAAISCLASSAPARLPVLVRTVLRTQDVVVLIDPRVVHLAVGGAVIFISPPPRPVRFLCRIADGVYFHIYGVA